MGTWIEYNFNSTELNEAAAKLEYNKPLHMTLVHFQRNITQSKVEMTEKTIDEWVKAFPSQFSMYSQGAIEKFDSGTIVQPYYAPKRIQDQRLILLFDLYSFRISFNNDYDWNPHVTIGQGEKRYTNLFIVEPELKIIGITFHHKFGDPHRWWLKP